MTLLTYKVEFWYNTDLRCDWEGPAVNDIAALGAALNSIKEENWSAGPGFRIEISLKDRS